MLLRPIGPVAAAAVAICAFGSSPARAETKVKLGTSARAAASSNPFLSTIDNARAMMAEIILNPSLTHSGPTTTVDLSSRLVRRHYSRLYDPATLGDVRMKGLLRRSERVQLNVSAFASRDVTSDAISEVPLDVGAAVDPRSVRLTAGLDVGANLMLSEQSSLSPTVSLRRNRYRRATSLSGYRGGAGGFAYTRRLSSRNRLGGRISVATASYDQGASSNIVALLAAGELGFSRTLSLTAEVGVERTSFRFSIPMIGNRTDRQILTTGGAKLCHNDGPLSLCGEASARSNATGFGDLQRMTNSALTANYRAGRDTRLSLRADYARSTPLGDSPFGRLSYFTARASIDREVGKSLTFSGYSTYRQRSGFRNANDATLGAELRWNMGQ